MCNEAVVTGSSISHCIAGMDLPAKHVDNTLQSAEFWTNKVLLADRSAPSQEWVKSLKELLKGLAAYVKQHHVAGPAWNPNGLPLSQFTPGAQPPSGEYFKGHRPHSADLTCVLQCNVQSKGPLCLTTARASWRCRNT